MKSRAEVSVVELSAEDAAVAMHAYAAHGHRVVGLEHDGAYSPELEEDGRLVASEVGAAALKACVFESVKYNLDLLHGKWIKVDGKSMFKPGFIKNNFSNEGQTKTDVELRPLREFVNRTKGKIRDSQRVNVILIDFLEQKQTEEAAA